MYEEAIRDFEQGILLGSRNLEALHGLSLANMSIGHYLDDLIYHDELILLQPDIPYMHAAIGAIKYALGKHQYASALIDLDRAIKLDPQLASAYYIRGAIYQAQGQNVKAKYDRDKSKELEAAQK